MKTCRERERRRERESEHLPWRLQAPFKKPRPGGLLRPFPRFKIKPIFPPSLSLPLILASPHLPYQNCSSLQSVRKSFLTAGSERDALRSIWTNFYSEFVLKSRGGGHGEKIKTRFAFICTLKFSLFSSERLSCTNALGTAFVKRQSGEKRADYHRSYSVTVIIFKRISVNGSLPPGEVYIFFFFALLVLSDVLHKCQAI